MKCLDKIGYAFFYTKNRTGLIYYKRKPSTFSESLVFVNIRGKEGCDQVTRQEQSLHAMQIEVDNYIKQFKVGYFSPLSQMARLTEEVGELAREINHHYGQKTKKNSEKPKTVAEEIGDVLIVTMIMANSLNINLTEAFQENMKKFEQRDHNRFERKDEQQNDKNSRGRI